MESAASEDSEITTSTVSPVGSTLLMVRPLQEVAIIAKTTTARADKDLIGFIACYDRGHKSSAKLLLIVNTEKLNLKDERCISGDSTGNAVLTVCEIGGDVKDCLATNLHSLQTLSPPFDNTVKRE